MTENEALSKRQWFLAGAAGIFSLPVLILLSAMTGFTALAYQSGLTRGEAVFMTGFVWALPSQLILVSAMHAGTGLIATFIAVCLAAIRFTPMIAALVPVIRGERTKTITLLVLSSFVAITTWVFTLQNAGNVPREGRMAFFAGFALTLTFVNTLAVFLLYGVVSTLPPIAAALLYFLTPMYFLTSLWGSAGHRVIHFALIAGIVVMPVFHTLAPQFEMLLTGLVAGTASYVVDRILRRRATPI